MNNRVASILKFYAVLNGLVWVIIGIYSIDSNYYGFEFLWLVEICAGLFVSFMIYAFGEVVGILDDIRSNTRKPESVSKSSDDELPDL